MIYNTIPKEFFHLTTNKARGSVPNSRRDGLKLSGLKFQCFGWIRDQENVHLDPGVEVVERGRRRERRVRRGGGGR